MKRPNPATSKPTSNSSRRADDAAVPRGPGGEARIKAGGKAPGLTTAQGTPIENNQSSLTAFERGPTLLEDFILREKITHFDHERIPERIVHARGSGAHGYFELQTSLKKYTKARVLTETGKRVPMFVRFSTVAGGAGSVDTPRDVRGFALKFYTEEGNWDLVGNDLPIFAIQDAIKFPDFIHAVKMEPDRGFPQAASAHDTFWDFVSLSPETLHMTLWAMSDRGIPRSLRMIEGFGIHSFRLINARGEATFVRFQWRPELGLQSTTWNEAVKLAGADPDFHRRDLFEAIQAGKFPAWEFGVQLFTEAQAEAFPFDHLDPTKLIPEELVPLRIIGRFVLDRWPDNFFAETEQAAFCPANLPPGIDLSNDPLLQGRLFSYLDTQLSRLGSPNFTQLPVNAPKCPFAHGQRDAHMQTAVPVGRVAYEPSSLDPAAVRESRSGFTSFAEPAPADAHKGRVRPASFADHYSQPRQFYRSQSDIEQGHIVSALVFELSKVETEVVRLRTLSHLRHVDDGLAQRVADGLGVARLPPPAAAAAPTRDLPPSPPLRLIDKYPATLEGRAIGILVADGSDGSVVARLKAAAEGAGATVKVVAPRLAVTLKGGKALAADGQLAGTPSIVFDAVASVLAPDVAMALAKDADAKDWFADAFRHLKTIAACQGTRAILDAVGIEADEGVVDPARADDFVRLASGRHWSREAAVTAHPA